jgi:cellulose 1,4-beta-cellobiosidase
MTTGTTSVTNLDLQALVADAVSRGYIRASWHLIGVEAGFEIWQGGAGLATTSFSVNVAGGS